MRFPIFALPLLALSALALPACEDVSHSGGTYQPGDSKLELDENGCPVSGVPQHGYPCEQDAVCAQAEGHAYCPDGPGMVFVCADDVWSTYVPLQCEPSGALTCDPAGTWYATRTGPYSDPGLVDEVDHFTIEITKDADGLLRAKDVPGGALSADGCKLDLFVSYYSSCGEAEGESYCTEKAHTSPSTSPRPPRRACSRRSAKASAATTSPHPSSSKSSSDTLCQDRTPRSDQKGYPHLPGGGEHPLARHPPTGRSQLSSGYWHAPSITWIA